MRTKSCYEILGVAPDASVEEIRAAYRKEIAALRESEAFERAFSKERARDRILLTVWASDMSPEKIARRREDVMSAYTVLCDEGRRAKHDDALAVTEASAIEYGAGPPVRLPFSSRADSSWIVSERVLRLRSLFKRSALLWGSCISLLFSIVLTISVVATAVTGETQTPLALFLSNARLFPLSLLAISFFLSLLLWYAMLFVVALGLRLACDTETKFDAGSVTVVLCGAFVVAWIAGACVLFLSRNSAHFFAALDADSDLLWPLFVMPMLVGSITFYKLWTTRISAYLYGLFLFLIVPLGHLVFVIGLASILTGGASVADYVFGGLHRLGGVAWGVLFFGAYQWYIGKKLEL